MYSPLSENFKRRIRESGSRKTVVDVYYDGSLVATDLLVSDGSIRVDLDGQVRRSGSITIADPRLVPTLAKTLSPLGTEVAVRHGVVNLDGTEELIPLGIFRLEVTEWNFRGGVPAIQIYDRSKGMATSAITGRISRAGYTASSAIKELLEWYYPQFAPIDMNALLGEGLSDYALPGGHVFEQGNYWDAASDLARNMGGRLFFDLTGFPRIEKIEDLNTVSAFDLEVSVGENGILVDGTHSYSRESVYNAVSVIGSTDSDGNAASAVAYNEDPSSPLRYGGPFGKAIEEITDSSLLTFQQCYIRARSELAKYTGLAYSLDFTAIPNPALDVGDFVKFTYPDGRSAVHQVSTLSIPLGKGTFTGTSRGLYLNE